MGWTPGCSPPASIDTNSLDLMMDNNETTCFYLAPQNSNEIFYDIIGNITDNKNVTNVELTGTGLICGGNVIVIAHSCSDTLIECMSTLPGPDKCSFTCPRSGFIQDKVHIRLSPVNRLGVDMSVCEIALTM